MRCFSFAVQLVPASDGKIVLAGCRSVGAPATAVAIEEMAVAGVEKLVAIDVAGSLSPDLRSGDVLLVERALAGDGTSPHYTSEAVVNSGESLTDSLGDLLTQNGIAYSRGCVWSTDAVYREAPSSVQAARDQGAVAVDMETAAVLAVASAMDIEASVLLVIADELSEGWRPPADMSRVHAQLRRLREAVAGWQMP
jgi:uridine phosphorylase